MLRNITGDTLRYVPGLYGMPGEGYIQVDPSESYQVIPLRDPLLRGALTRTQFLVTNVHGAGGTANSATLNFWSATDWGTITNGLPVPVTNDVLVLGAGINSTGGAQLITRAHCELRWEPAAGIIALLPLFSCRISPGTLGLADLMSAPFLPYALDRDTRPTMIFRSEVSAATDILFTVDVIHAPAGVIPFA